MTMVRQQWWLPLLLLVAFSSASAYYLPFKDMIHVSNLSDLPLDENNRLVDNWLLFVDNPSCRTMALIAWMEVTPAFRRVASIPLAVADLYNFNNDSKRDASASMFSLFSEKKKPVHCGAVHLNKGMKSEYLQHVLPDDKLVLTPQNKTNEFINWLRDRSSCELGIASHSVRHKHMIVYWVNPANNERVPNGDLEYGEKNTLWLESHIGHEFIIMDSKTGYIVSQHFLTHSTFIVVGEKSKMKLTRNVTEVVRETLHKEWDRSRSVKRTFTELGFARGKLPLDLFASMSTYYYNNRLSLLREEWSGNRVFVNHWEVDVYMIIMPWVLKKYWQSRLKDLVQSWSGVELELTDIYGMRRYQDGARLLTHVDREETHAASLIINVGQSNIREPWAVEIYDHADRLHEVVMEEGDIVYYESARCLHGRMRPLAGESYVNLFAHYRPVGDPAWFLKPNPSDGVQPLMDIGDCSRPEGSATTVCSSGVHAPFLSPRKEILLGPDSLFEFYQQVSPVPAKAAAVAAVEATVPSVSGLGAGVEVGSADAAAGSAGESVTTTLANDEL